MQMILKNKKGVTILEGLIALTLLALVATGTFAVLLSTSRKTQGPDIREEMSLAVNNASSRLQLLITPDWGNAKKYYNSDNIDGLDGSVPGIVANGKLCSEDGHNSPDGGKTPAALASGQHNIVCLLPPICDASNSSFTYVVSDDPFTSGNLKNKLRSDDRNSVAVASKSYSIKFSITCNGYTYER